jgi:tetratricopeptide (TPR) repeat protein
MGVGWKLDLARAAPGGDSLIRFLFALGLLLLLPAAVPLQSAAGQSAAPTPAAKARQLFEEHQWAEVVRLVKAQPNPSPELNYYCGVALAQLGRWDQARQALLAGFHQLPNDKRFAEELAGVEFRQKANRRAAFWLQHALAIDPHDEYANDFLGTIYFLQGNLEAALKYWNQVGKPHLGAVRSEPEPALNPVLLDSAFAFAAGSTLSVADLLTTEARINSLGIFPLHTLQLAAQPSGDFDAVFRSYERIGWGKTRTEGLIRLFRGAFAQTVYPEYFNIGHSAMNFTSLARWDKEKRRYAATLSAPLHNNASRRYSLGLDVRNENWDIRRSSQGPAPVLGSMNLRRQALSAEVSIIPSGRILNGRWNWQTGVEFSHRDFRNVVEGGTLSPDILLTGYQLKHTAQVNYDLLRIPEQRLVISTSGKSELGRIWSEPRQLFAKLQAESALHWFPQLQGTDYEVQSRLRAGKIVGDSPFDELFQLGLERDNDLGLRAHIGTRDGRKGSAPLGRNYILFNEELDKIIYANGWISLRLSPFLDSGKIIDSSLALAPKQWLWDTGIQIKTQLLGVSLVLTYGKDLRSGNNVFYVALGQ